MIHAENLFSSKRYLAQSIGATICLISLFLAACGTQEDEDQNLLLPYVGTWLGSCSPVGHPDAGSAQPVLVFSAVAKEVEIMTRFYVSSGCTGSIAAEVSNTFDLKANGAGPGGEGLQIERLIKGSTAKPVSTAMTSAWNTNTPCGLSGWTSGVAQSWYTATCSGNMFSSTPITVARGADSFSIIKIDSSVTPNQIYFSSSSSAYPTEFSNTHWGVKE